MVAMRSFKKSVHFSHSTRCYVSSDGTVCFTLRENLYGTSSKDAITISIKSVSCNSAFPGTIIQILQEVKYAFLS
jgi:hypothetical protein